MTEKPRRLPRGWSKEHLALCRAREPGESGPIRFGEYHPEISKLRIPIHGPAGATMVEVDAQRGCLPEPAPPGHQVRVSCGHRMLYRFERCFCGVTLTDMMPQWGLPVCRLTGSIQDPGLEVLENRLRVEAELGRLTGIGRPMKPTAREARALLRAIATIEGVLAKPWGSAWFPTHSSLYDVRLGTVLGTLEIAANLERVPGPNVDPIEAVRRRAVARAVQRLPHKDRADAYGDLIREMTGRLVADSARELNHVIGSR